MSKEHIDPREHSLSSGMMTVGTNFAAGMLVLGYLGHLLDGYLDSGRTYRDLGVIIGIAWGFYELIKLVKKQNKINYPDENDKK